MSQVSVLVVEDDPAVRALLQDALQMAGFKVTAAQHAEEAQNLLRTDRPDIIVSDINLPGSSGLDLLEWLRAANNQIPFIALTARTDKQDVATGFRTGADDYITKPFGLEELVLRINAVLRRSGVQRTPASETIGDLALDRANVRVLFDGVDLGLSPTEYKLFEVLYDNRNRVVRKQVLMREVWGFNFETSNAILDTYISYLRRKLPAAGRVAVRTTRGVGFKLEETE